MNTSRKTEISLMLESWRLKTRGTEAYMTELHIAATELNIHDSEMFEFFKEVFTASLPASWKLVTTDVNTRIREKSVEELEVSVRTYNCLKNTNIKTVGEAMDKTDEELRQTKYFGPKSIRELRAVISQLLK